MKKSKTLVLAFAVAGTTAAVAFAHNGATGIVKERMDGMMAMGKVIKELSSMMRGEIEFDTNIVKVGAQTIQSHAGEAMTKLFPEGSLQKASVAKEEIWTEWKTFETMALQLQTYAEGLEAAADNGLGHGGGASTMMGTNGTSMMGTSGSSMMGNSSTMMGSTVSPMMSAEQLSQMPTDGVFNMVTQTCSACHTKFRIEKK